MQNYVTIHPNQQMQPLQRKKSISQIKHHNRANFSPLININQNQTMVNLDRFNQNQLQTVKKFHMSKDKANNSRVNSLENFSSYNISRCQQQSQQTTNLSNKTILQNQSNRTIQQQQQQQQYQNYPMQYQRQPSHAKNLTATAPNCNGIVNINLRELNKQPLSPINFRQNSHVKLDTMNQVEKIFSGQENDNKKLLELNYKLQRKNIQLQEENKKQVQINEDLQQQITLLKNQKNDLFDKQKTIINNLKTEYNQLKESNLKESNILTENKQWKPAQQLDITILKEDKTPRKFQYNYFDTIQIFPSIQNDQVTNQQQTIIDELQNLIKLNEIQKNSLDKQNSQKDEIIQNLIEQKNTQDKQIKEIDSQFVNQMKFNDEIKLKYKDIDNQLQNFNSEQPENKNEIMKQYKDYQKQLVDKKIKDLHYSVYEQYKDIILILQNEKGKFVKKILDILTMQKVNYEKIINQQRDDIQLLENQQKNDKPSQQILQRLTNKFKLDYELHTKQIQQKALQIQDFYKDHQHQNLVSDQFIVDQWQSMIEVGQFQINNLISEISQNVQIIKDEQLKIIEEEEEKEYIHNTNTKETPEKNN